MRGGNERPPYAVRWELLIWPSIIISFILLAIPQGIFIWMSLHEALGFGRLGEALSVNNYVQIVTDPFYLNSLWKTFYLSFGAMVIGLIISLPTAYLLARSRASWASLMIGLLLIASFVTVVIKVIGLLVMLSQGGLINRFLIWIGILETPLRLIHNEIGVLIGLIQYTLPLLVMILFSVIQTIPRSIEDAAEIHGASQVEVFRRVLLPLARPGILAAALMVFNMNAGAFTSAVLLGGGRVLTLPVLIQRKISMDVDYPVGASLSTTLVLFVFIVNIVVGTYVMRRVRRQVRGI